MKIPGTASLLLFAVFFFSTSFSAIGQSSAEDSLFYKKAVAHLFELYRNAAGDQSRLLNGSQYGSYPFHFENDGHPFFNDNKPGIGSVLYDGVLYENVSLQYDEIVEALVEDSTKRIQLINDRVERFSVFGTNFIRIVKDTLSNKPLKTGFYNILYEGNSSVLKREEKLIREEVSTGTLLRFIDPHISYHIKKGNLYFNVRSKGSVLDIFADRKKDIKQYIRKNKLSYKKDRDNMLIKTAAYYDQMILSK